MSSTTAVRVRAVRSTSKSRMHRALQVGAVATAATAAITSCAIPSSSRTAARAASVAQAQVGKPYVYGATGPGSFDCSGLTGYAYRAAGKTLPRTALQQYNATAHIPKSQARPGDLVFMGTPGSHVGIWISPGMMVDAGKPATGVVRRPMWSQNYVVGRVR